MTLRSLAKTSLRPAACDGARVIRALSTDEVEVVGTVLGLARLHQGDGEYLVAWDGPTPSATST